MVIPINILRGSSYALAACIIWGLIFVVPLFMEGYTPIEIAIGRYFTYGIFSSAILFRICIQKGKIYPFSIFLRAIGYSFACSVGYYIFVILSMRYSSPAICTLILGVSPITIAFYGNWKQKECSYRSLMIPSILICIGLAVINTPSILEASSPSTYILGLIYALLALGAWTWYLVANFAFLKKNPTIDSGVWSTLIGVGTLFWALILGIAAIIFFDDQLNFRKYVDVGPELTNFLIGCLILGFLCSWVGAYLWNKASLYLPVSLAGQLTIMETFFGLFYVYLLEQRFPPLLEFLGILLFVVAIVYGIQVSSQERAKLTEI
jgi:drug/metabolite transporter (DMT)-like permease